jgi:hypothetical protein
VRSLGENACRRFFFFLLLLVVCLPLIPSSSCLSLAAGMLDVLNKQRACESLPVESSLKKEKNLLNFLGVESSLKKEKIC